MSALDRFYYNTHEIRNGKSFSHAYKDISGASYLINDSSKKLAVVSKKMKVTETAQLAQPKMIKIKSNIYCFGRFLLKQFYCANNLSHQSIIE